MKYAAWSVTTWAPAVREAAWAVLPALSDAAEGRRWTAQFEQACRAAVDLEVGFVAADQFGRADEGRADRCAQALAEAHRDTVEQVGQPGGD